MNIGQAVEAMRSGARVARSGWNGKGMWIALHEANHNETMTEPFVYMRTAQGCLIPWLCSQADLLAVDWTIVAA